MADVKIFAETLEDSAKAQIKTLSNCMAYKDSIIRIMPDCHAGIGCTIGSVIKFNNRIIPNTVGVDIGCGMYVVNMGNVEIDFASLDQKIRNHIPYGRKVYNKPQLNQQAFSLCTKGVSSWDYIQKSLGTLGGGNHFIEIDVDNKNDKYLIIHTGSRHLGVETCKYWQKKAGTPDISSTINEMIQLYRQTGREKEIQAKIEEIKANVQPFNLENKDLYFLSGTNVQAYLKDMKKCQLWATLNRELIARKILAWLKVKKPKFHFHTIHNYVDIENNIIRKGAVDASKGVNLVIPINMRDGSLLCIGKGNKEWLCSAPHGAGRLMSRNKAVETLKLEDYKESMKGIYTSSVNELTIDEAPMVYKPIDEIVRLVEPTVDIQQIIKPLYNFKANE